MLVDNKCASACEYFSQHLQKLGRATIVGQYASEGAGGPVDEHVVGLHVAVDDPLLVGVREGSRDRAGDEEGKLAVPRDRPGP